MKHEVKAKELLTRFLAVLEILRKAQQEQIQLSATKNTTEKGEEHHD